MSCAITILAVGGRRGKENRSALLFGLLSFVPRDSLFREKPLSLEDGRSRSRRTEGGIGIPLLRCTLEKVSHIYVHR